MRMRSMFIAMALALTAIPFRAAAPDTFGSGVSLHEITPLTQIIGRPAEFEGKTVRVEGVVTAVCAHMGCWMALSPDGGPAGSTVMLKVDDGVVVFPVTAKGRRATAQGVVERVGGSAEGREAAAEHAQQSARDGQAKTAPTAWQIKTTGAVLY